MANRFFLLDNFRGLTLLSMIAYHGTWDLVFLFGYNLGWYRTTPGYIWQQSICWSFIFLSGFCSNLGHHSIRRGFLVSIAGGIVTAVTLLFMPEEQVLFGILTFLGAAMLVTAIGKPFLNKIDSHVGILLSALLFVLFKNVNTGTVGFERFVLGTVPRPFYQGYFMTFLGFPKPGFFSTDYFSFFPWIFLFLAGSYFYGIMEQNQWLNKLRGGEGTPFAWLGRHSLEIYLIHQPILYGLFTLLSEVGK